MDIDNLFKDGYFIGDINHGIFKNLSIFALQSSLESYVKTAVDLDYLYDYKRSNQNLPQDKEDELHGVDYAMDACNSIVHFQHFLELFLKDILLEVDKLLVYDASAKPLLLYKMIKQENVSDNELEGVKFIEFSEAIDRVYKLLDEDKLDGKYDFIKKYKSVFTKVNSLRNRIAHRGAFVIRHKALDELFGTYILPFIQELSSKVPLYKTVFTWHFKVKDENLKPFASIIEEYQKSSTNELRVYIYKLIAHSSVNNNIDYHIGKYFHSFMEGQIRDAEEAAEAIATKSFKDVKVCPVCGCKTFIETTDCADDEDDNGEIINHYTFAYSMECHQCGFKLNNWLIDKVKDLGVQIPDFYWFYKQ